MNSSNKLVNYDNVEQQYLEKRQLKPSAGWILLWAMGVGAVISGDFFGWNLGLAKSGFGGLLVATADLLGGCSQSIMATNRGRSNLCARRCVTR